VTATLHILSGDRRYLDLPARRLELRCPHGSTEASFVGGDDGRADASVTRLLLVAHFESERCRCTHRLWREHFGCEWPEIPLVRSVA
jgi:hypothetical protein